MRTIARPRDALLALSLAGAVLAPAFSRGDTPVVSRASAPDGEPSLLLSDRAARELHLRSGDRVELSRDGSFETTRTFRVAGTYHPAADPSEIGADALHVLLHLPDLEDLTGEYDRTTSITLRTAPGAASEEVAREIGALNLGVSAYPSSELARASSQTFEVVRRFHLAIGLVTLAAGAVFLLAIMVLAVDESRREFGALRLIGVRSRTIAYAVLLASVAIAVAGSIVGVGLAYLASHTVNHIYQAHYKTDLVFARVSQRDVALAVALSIVLGVAAALGAFARLVRAEVLKLFGR
jgi:putative ABC transport system permease protein